MDIETIYRCRIDYKRLDEDNDDRDDDITDRVWQLGRREPKVEIETFDGCPACHPYILLESENLPALKRLGAKIERYINRRKLFQLGVDD